jgi:hypothetical protein
MKRPRSKSRKKKSKKNHAWTASTVLSLILTAVGLVALVELWPQVEVFPQEEVAQAQPFLAPFRIHNSGYLPFTIKRALCYVDELKQTGATISASLSQIRGLDGSVLDGSVLERAGDATGFCRFSEGRPEKVNMVLVVDYVSWGAPVTSRAYVRFVGAYIDRWEWLKQPVSSDLKRAADKEIADDL